MADYERDLQEVKDLGSKDKSEIIKAIKRNEEPLSKPFDSIVPKSLLRMIIMYRIYEMRDFNGVNQTIKVDLSETVKPIVLLLTDTDLYRNLNEVENAAKLFEINQLDDKCEETKMKDISKLRTDNTIDSFRKSTIYDFDSSRYQIHCYFYCQNEVIFDSIGDLDDWLFVMYCVSEGITDMLSIRESKEERILSELDKHKTFERIKKIEAALKAILELLPATMESEQDTNPKKKTRKKL